MTMEASSSQSVSFRSAERKAPSAFRTISEVATTLEVPAHVLRFWESKFQQVRPLKRGGGRRYYRPEDVDLLSNIKDLLYNQGFTIRGVQKLLREGKSSEVAASSVPAVPASVGRSASSTSKLSLNGPARREIESVLSELQSLRDLLRDNGI